MDNAKVSDGSQPPMTMNLSVSETAGPRSLHRLVERSHCAGFRLENIQTILSTMTPHIKPLNARSKIKTGKDQEPWSP
jgi:hypothetical protein